MSRGAGVLQGKSQWTVTLVSRAHFSLAPLLSQQIDVLTERYWMWSHAPSQAPVAEICVHWLALQGKSQGLARHRTPSTKTRENRVKDFPHIDFTLATTRFWFRNHVAQKFILGAGQVVGLCLLSKLINSTYKKHQKYLV